MKSEVHKVYRAVDRDGEVYYIVVEEVSDKRGSNDRVAFFAVSPHRATKSGEEGCAWIYSNSDGRNTLDDIIKEAHFSKVEDTGLNIIDLFKIIEEKRNGNKST